MTDRRHVTGLKHCGLFGLAVSISYLLASAQPHFRRFSQCLCLACFFPTFDGCATFSGCAVLTVFAVFVDFIAGVPN
jgi:hypothetical protein